MAENKIQTRLQLKRDTYAKWEAVKDTFKPLPGEVCIAEIPSNNAAATTAPTVLFKVGAYKKDSNGNNTTELCTFGDLKWASALAADVYEWAKKTEAEVYARERAADMRTLQSRKRTEILKDIQAQIARSAALLGYGFVLDYSGRTTNDLGAVLLYPPQRDFTLHVISELNRNQTKKNKSGVSK